MGALFENAFLNLVIIASILVIFFYKRKFRYWKNLGVEYREPTFFVGNSKNTLLRRISTGQHYADFYQYLKDKKAMHGGDYFFHIPIYVPVDLDLVKQIMQVDFVHFMDHNAYINEKDDPLTAHLFALKGQRWRNLRTKLTPTFTSGKMKSIFPIMVQISQELTKALKRESKNNEAVEAKSIAGRYTTDVIGNFAFGIDCNSLLTPDTEFRIKGKRLFDLTPLESIRLFACFAVPNLMKALHVRFFPKEATDFFLDIIKETTNYREENNIKRNDLLQILLDMKNNEDKNSDATLTFDELAAQAFVFYVGGFDTSSTLLSFALLELAANQHVQSKLRDEINEILNQSNGECTYDNLREMHYLDMVINETLRKYPPIPALTRMCTKDYQVANTNVVIKKEDALFIPIQGIHYDPEYYPNPHEFDPTRFNEENKNKRHQFAFIPFGEGSRMCIGLRFGMMQAKVGLATVVKNFKIKVNSQTKLPIRFDPKNFFTTALGGLWLDFEEIY